MREEEEFFDELYKEFMSKAHNNQSVYDAIIAMAALQKITNMLLKEILKNGKT